MITMAALGAVGVFLIWTSTFGGLSVVRRVSLGSRFFTDTDQGGTPYDRSRSAGWLDALIGDPLSGLIQILGRALAGKDYRAQLERLGFPSPYSHRLDVVSWKVLLAAVLFGLAAMLVLLTGVAALVLVAVAFAAIGFHLPDVHLSQLEARRRGEILVEMSYLLDQMAIQLAAGRTLPMVLTHISTQPGGWFLRELRSVAQEYQSGGNLVAALEGLRERNSGDMIDALANRLILSIKHGVPLAEALQVMATSARERLETSLLEQGLVNSVLMPIPIGLVVMLGVALAIMAPGLSLALGNL